MRNFITKSPSQMVISINHVFLFLHALTNTANNKSQFDRKMF